MQIEIKKKFEKDIDKINNVKLLETIFNIITEIENASVITEINNLKKLQGYNDYYRIRIGNYRMGLKIENSIVIFVRFLHRKDVYKYFP
jgi:mRNA interferase RelE/StbE